MSVENNHTEWAVFQFSNNYCIWLALSPFKITRLTKKCRLIVQQSSNVTKYDVVFIQSMFLLLQITPGIKKIIIF